jgi:hypothetical protein
MARMIVLTAKTGDRLRINPENVAYYYPYHEGETPKGSRVRMINNLELDVVEEVAIIDHYFELRVVQR